MNQPNHHKSIPEFSESRFKAIVQTASDSIIISDENSIIVFANQKTYEIFGYPEGSLIGSDLEILMPEKFKQGHKTGFQRFLAGGDSKLIGHTVEIEGLRKDGIIFPLELSLSSWKEEGCYFFAGIIRDITEKKETSINFQNQQEELAAAIEELKAAEEELRAINDDLENRVEIRTRELAESEGKVKQSEEQLRLITDAVPALISYVRSDLTYGFANKAYENLFQVNREDIIGRPIKEVIGEKAYSNSLPLIEKALRGEFVESEVFQDYGAKIGKKWRRASFVPHQVEGKITGAFVLVEDITKLKNIQFEQELANQKLREKDEFYQALIEHGSDFINVLDEKLNYLYCGGAILRELGYKPEQLIGDNALKFIHPDDIPLAKESLAKGLTSREPIKISELRFKNAKGEWRWLEATLSNQLSNPAVKALVVSSRDITDRVNDRLKLQESQQRFKSLFDNHLDIVLFQNKDGIILDVNAAALSFFGAQKQDVLNRSFADFLPDETVPVCENALQDALNGESVRYEIEIPFEEKGLHKFDIAKMPVVVNGETIGVFTILKDITAISHSNHIIKRQAEKLNTILESITDAFFTLDRNWNLTYANSELEKLFDTKREEILGKCIWERIPNEVNGEFYTQFQNALERGKTVHFEAFYEKHNKWLEVKAFPSEEGLSIFINDITESVLSKQELEKLSLVASKAVNGVLILDAEGRIEWLNDGFTKHTGYTFSEVVGSFPGSFLGGEDTDKATTEQLVENLKQGKPFTGEVLCYSKYGEKLWVLLDFTPILNENEEVTRFIVIETDITGRKEAEENQLKMTNDLFRQNRDLQQFTYIVSHNLRSPVANIMGLADLLTTYDDRGSAIFEVSLSHLKNTVDQLDTVLRDLNQILSVRNNKDTSGKEKVNLALVCQQVTASLQEPLNECGGKVYMDIEEGTYVNGNKGYIYSIFYNLLSNSIKYRSPDRTLKVGIKCLDSSDRGIVISFSDNGLGFDMEKVGENIFKLYKRFHSNYEGRGIGLFLVKTHVEAMDGHIEVSSKVDSGTRFLIYLK